MSVRGSDSLGIIHGPTHAAQRWWMVVILPLLGALSPRASVSTTTTVAATAATTTVRLVAGSFRHLVLGDLAWRFCVFTARCILGCSTSSFGPWSIGFGFWTYMIRKLPHFESFRSPFTQEVPSNSTATRKRKFFKGVF